MARPQDIIEAVLYTLQSHPDIPERTSFVGYEPNIDTESIKLPLIEVSPLTQTNISEMNTDFVGFKEDSNGNQIGRIYESLYQFEITVAVWTAQGSKFSPRDMSDSVRDALYAHETAGPNKPLMKEDGTPLDEVWRFSIMDGEQIDDMGTSPTLRRWEQNVVINASEQYVTDEEDPIETIDFGTSPQ